MRNRKITMIIAIIGAVILLFSVVYKFFIKGDSNQEDPASSAIVSEVSSTLESNLSSSQESNNSSSGSGSSGSVVSEQQEQSSKLPSEESNFLEDYKNIGLTEEEVEEEMNELIIQAGQQILIRGGVWTMEEDPAVQLGFEKKKFTLSGAGDKVTGNYEVVSATCDNPNEYVLELSDGSEWIITDMGSNIYLLTVPKDAFPELDAADEVTFIKTANIVLGAQQQYGEDGMTDQERDEQGVTYTN